MSRLVIGLVARKPFSDVADAVWIESGPGALLFVLRWRRPVGGELIKTSGGKYVAPAKIEGKLKTLPIIQEAVVVGDRRNYCVCLISIDPEELEAWAAQQGVPAEVHSEAVKSAVQAKIDDVNSGLASFETVKYFRLLPEPMTVENGILTASLKVKRRIVEERYADLIDEMYAT